MDVQQVMSTARDALTVSRVFGEPIQRDGVTVVPVARIMGGSGGGAGTEEQAGGVGKGAGAGFGLRAQPAGVFVIKGDTVSWQPATDVNRLVLGGQVLAGLALLTLRAIARRRARR